MEQSKCLEKLIETEQRSKSNARRLDDLDHRIEDIHNLALSVAEIAVEMKAMREDVNKMDIRISTIESKPGKRFDQVIGYILSALISGGIAFLLTYLGLK